MKGKVENHSIIRSLTQKACEKFAMDAGIEKWRRLYEVAAREPDWIRAHRWGYSQEIALRTIADIRAKLAPRSQDRLLEVGCGSGMVLGSLLREDQSGVGADLCEALIRKAHAFGVDRRRVKLMVAEAGQLPFSDNSFDRVLCYSVFQCFPSANYGTHVFKELIRVCKPGGTILIGDVFGYVEMFRATWYQEGFGINTIRTALGLPLLKPIFYALWPARRLIRAVRNHFRPPARSNEHGLGWHHYSHQFFRRLGKKYGAHVEILDQNIPGKEIVSTRFDARLTKRSS